MMAGTICQMFIWMSPKNTAEKSIAQTGFTPLSSKPRSTIPLQSHSSKIGAKIDTQMKLTQNVPEVRLFKASSSHSGMGGMIEVM